MTSIVSARALSHKYTRGWAIRDVNLDFERSGVYGIVGSNGAGKSTFMNILCGVLSPTEGELEIAGTSVVSAPLEAKAKLGYLPQQPPLYPELTIDEYLAYCGRLRGLNKRDRLEGVTKAKDVCGLSSLSGRLIGALSGGYRQRVGLAQSILHEPPVVVLDEPTNGLDPNQIKTVRGLIKRIGEERTVIVSTHMLSEVQALCDHVSMIEAGKIVFGGTVEEFSALIEPQSVFAAWKRPPDLQELSALEGVRSVVFVSPNAARVRFSDLETVTDRIVEDSAKSHRGLYELSPEKASLEEVFALLSGVNSRLEKA